MRGNAGRRHGQGGFIVVAVIIIVALIFFIGTAIALAVSSSLHAIAEVTSNDGIAYAADSAVARGTSSNLQTAAAGRTVPNCPSSGSIQEGTVTVPFGVQCYFAARVTASTPADIQQWGSPAQTLQPGSAGCATVPLGNFPNNTANVWTTVGFRAPDPTTAALVWIDDAGACRPNSDQICPGPLRTTPGTPAYYFCHLTSTPNLFFHVQSQGGLAQLGPLVVRASQDGPDCVATAIGSAGLLASEMDIVLPLCGTTGAVASLWNGVLR